jgi:hypothetical protein
MVKWADAYTNLTSRQWLIQAALQENALLVAAHMAVGWIEGTMANPRRVAL